MCVFLCVRSSVGLEFIWQFQTVVSFFFLLLTNYHIFLCLLSFARGDAAAAGAGRDPNCTQASWGTAPGDEKATHRSAIWANQGTGKWVMLLVCCYCLDFQQKIDVMKLSAEFSQRFAHDVVWSFFVCLWFSVQEAAAECERNADSSAQLKEVCFKFVVNRK